MTSSKKLVLLGTGIKSVSHLSQEALPYIKQADCVLHLLNESVMAEHIQKLNNNCQPLDEIYFQYSDRNKSYQAISEAILSKLDEHDFISVVFYGHPTVFAEPGLQAIKKAKSRGIETLILPAISAQDCLFADLEIDPGKLGYTSIEVTEFLTKKRILDPCSHLILWQIGMLANFQHPKETINHHALNLLQAKLQQYYTENHQIIIYEAALYPGLQSRQQAISLSQLASASYTTLSTLYIAPSATATIDEKVCKALNLVF